MRIGRFGVGFFVGLVLFFLPSNRVICKNSQYDVLPLCE